MLLSAGNYLVSVQNCQKVWPNRCWLLFFVFLTLCNFDVWRTELFSSFLKLQMRMGSSKCVQAPCMNVLFPSIYDAWIQADYMDGNKYCIAWVWGRPALCMTYELWIGWLGGWGPEQIVSVVAGCMWGKPTAWRCLSDTIRFELLDGWRHSFSPLRPKFNLADLDIGCADRLLAAVPDAVESCHVAFGISESHCCLIVSERPLTDAKAEKRSQPNWEICLFAQLTRVSWEDDWCRHPLLPLNMRLHLEDG